MPTGKRDELVARVPWEFDFEVTSVFEDMISRSIPGYADLRHLINRICMPYLNRSENTTVMDLGCSTGIQIGEFLRNGSGVNNSFIGLDNSKEMVAAAQKTFAQKPNVKILDFDLVANETFPKCDVALSVFTLQFVPVEKRLSVLTKIYSAIEPNGLFLMAEKILGRDKFSNEYLVEKHHEIKRSNGYTTHQITSKSIALEGVLIPVSIENNMNLLKSAGFKSVELFWLNLNFAGFIAWK